MALDNPTTQAAVTTADKVFEQILHAIVNGNIKAGSKISEPELAKNYQISRSTLREALNRLEKCHLIERKANVGSRVDEHSRIIEAIADRDGELAEMLMRRHIAASRKNIENKIALQQ